MLTAHCVLTCCAQYSVLDVDAERCMRLYRDRHNELPVNHVGLLSFVFCSWLDPIMWRMFRHPDYDPIDRCQCPDLEKAAANADR